MSLRILHIYKKGYTKVQQHYLGSVKDIRSRTEYFLERGIEYKELFVSGKFHKHEDLECIFSIPLSNFDAVILEMTFSPSILILIRRIVPNMILMVRSHNAELLHRIHWAKARGLSASAARFIFQALKNFALDLACSRLADFILPISQWEANIYWKRFAPLKKIKYVPFYLPHSYLNNLKPNQKKIKLCVNFGSSLNNPIIADATNNFISAVSSLDSDFNDWEFISTGAKPSQMLFDSTRIRWRGVISNPYTVLRPARVIAILSDYGMGFKTKILEAISARCFVIMPYALYSRQPMEVRPYCIPINLRSKGSFKKALAMCCDDFPSGDPNLLLRKKAFSALDDLMSIISMKREKSS